MSYDLSPVFAKEKPFFLIAGPCVIESQTLLETCAGTLKEICEELGILLVFKASFDKANRTHAQAFRGPGLEKGLQMLEHIRSTFQLPILTDVHEDTPLEEVAHVVDILQTPAFLCRQTNFIQNVARQGKPVNIKKGQFLAPWDMQHVLEKARQTGNESILLCERGTSFGYNRLISDMTGLSVMRSWGAPVIYDATHSVQLPGGQGQSSGGVRAMVPVLARAAIAARIDGLFMETHPEPDKALSDGPNMWPLHRMRDLLKTLVALDAVVKASPLDETTLA